MNARLGMCSTCRHLPFIYIFLQLLGFRGPSNYRKSLQNNHKPPQNTPNHRKLHMKPPQTVMPMVPMGEPRAEPELFKNKKKKKKKKKKKTITSNVTLALLSGISKEVFHTFLSQVKSSQVKQNLFNAGVVQSNKKNMQRSNQNPSPGLKTKTRKN